MRREYLARYLLYIGNLVFCVCYMSLLCTAAASNTGCIEKFCLLVQYEFLLFSLNFRLFTIKREEAFFSF